MSRRSSALALVAAAAVSALALTGCAGAEPSSSGERRRRRDDRLRAPAGAGVRLRRMDRAGVPLLSGARQPGLARRGPPGRAVARRVVGGVRGRAQLDLHPQAGRRVHRRHARRRRGHRLQLRLLGRRRQQHGIRLAARLLLVGDRGRRPDGAHRPVASVPAPGRQPHAGLLRHPVAERSRDPHRRGELRRTDRVGRIRRRPLGPRSGDRADPQRRLHVVAGQRRAHRSCLRRRGRLEVRSRRHHARRRPAEPRGQRDLRRAGRAVGDARRIRIPAREVRHARSSAAADLQHAGRSVHG